MFSIQHDEITEPQERIAHLVIKTACCITIVSHVLVLGPVVLGPAGPSTNLVSSPPARILSKVKVGQRAWERAAWSVV